MSDREIKVGDLGTLRHNDDDTWSAHRRGWTIGSAATWADALDLLTTYRDPRDEGRGTVVSGPLEELQAAMDAYDSGSWEVVADATADIVAAARALLAASGTGERPADEQPAGLLTGIGPKFPSGAATIIAWANGGTIEGPDLVRELAAWLAYFGGASTPTPPAIQLATPRDAGTGERPAVCRNFAPSWDAEGRWRCIHCAGCAADHAPDAGTGTPSDDGRARRRARDVEAAASVGLTLLDEPYDRVTTGRKIDEGIQPFCPECLACGSDGGTPVRGLTADRSECAEDGTLVLAATPAAPSGTTGATTGDES